MDAFTHLFYGLGQVVYAVSLADGKVQREEEKKLHDIITQNLKESSVQYDYADIIFKILKHDNLLSADQAYEEGMKNIKLGDHKINEDLKTMFIKIVQDVADAFPPTTSEESRYIIKFCEDISTLGE